MYMAPRIDALLTCDSCVCDNEETPHTVTYLNTNIPVVMCDRCDVVFHPNILTDIVDSGIGQQSLSRQLLFSRT